MRSTVIAIALACLALAQAQEPRFEVASIKPSAPGARGTTLYSPTAERFAAASITAKGLVAFAYDVRQFQISGGPGWFDSEPYDVVARPDGDIGGDRIRGMVRSLLAERFQLKVQRESREMAVFALVVAKGGAKLNASAAAGPDLRGGDGRLTAAKITMGMLARTLGDRLGRPVLDKTGISGEFDFKLEWTPDDSKEPGPSISTALEEQLGLKLETQRAPVEILVVNHVERPSAN